MTTDLHDDQHDLAWVADHRPHAIALDDRATLRARSALMEDVRAAERPTRERVPAAEQPRHRRDRRLGAGGRRRDRRPRAGWARIAGGAAVAGTIAVAVVLATGGPSVTRSGSDGDRASHLRLGGGVAPASAAPLVHLSNRLHASAAQSSAALPGDATLIVRRQRDPDGSPVEGVDLFTDAGTYYSAPTRDGLAAQIAAQREHGDQGEDRTFVKRVADAAAAAFDGTIDQARRRMADAALRPGTSDADAGPPASLLAGLTPAEAKVVAARVAASNAADAAKRDAADPLDAGIVLENHVWTNVMDALSAGAARPEVRAGSLHLLASMRTVKVAKDREDGRDVLVLTSRAFRDDYTEALTIDAATGLPIRFAGGEAGQRPVVTITYDVSRVTVSDVAGGR